MANRRYRRVAAALAVCGVVLTAHGLWIPAKAQLAQVLLARAWEHTARHGEPKPPWPWADTHPIARLRAPRLGVDLIVLEGSTGRSLAFAPGHVAGTALPGKAGNSVISAHRDTQFRFLRDLRHGDLLVVETPEAGRQSYRVTDTAVVEQHATWLLQPTDPPALTLLTCYPFDAVIPGGPLRYAVRAVSERSA